MQLNPPRLHRPAIESMGLALGVAAVLVALAAYNSSLGPAYSAFWERATVIGFDGSQSFRTLGRWIDVALLPLLFAHLGTKVKRDFLREASRRAWSIPPRMGAAIGSAMIPAALYAGAVLAALFASKPDFATGRLEIAVGAAAALVILNQSGVQRVLPYAAGGIVLWLALLGSGIHPVIAGAILALTTPVVRDIPEDEFFERAALAIEAFEHASGPRLASWQLRQQDALGQVTRAATGFQTPLTRIDSVLRPVSFLLVIPLFLLANAGVTFSNAVRGFDWRIAAAVALGVLVVRASMAWGVSVQKRRGARVDDEWWRVVADTTWLGGVGITMSLFAAKLMFTPWSLESAKIGIFTGSAAVWLLAWWRVTGSIVERERLRSRLSVTALQENP